MQRNIFVCLAVLFLMYMNCIKSVDITTSSSYTPRDVIECILVPEKKPQVYFSRSVPFFDAQVTPQELFIRDALVYISCNSVTDTLVPDSTYDVFRSRWELYYKGSIEPRRGNTYQLTILSQGVTYTAQTTIYQPKVAIQSIEYIEEFFDAFGGHDGVTVTIQDPPGVGQFYRFQMDRIIDSSRHHAHVLDELIPKTDEKFPVTDLGRIIFNDTYIDGQEMEMLIEVSFEYRKGDTAWVFIQSLDSSSADFFQEIDNQMQSILNPFIEPEFITTKIPGAIGVFGSAVYSDSVLFIYPQDNPD